MRQKVGMKFATDGDWSAIEPLRGSADAAGWDSTVLAGALRSAFEEMNCLRYWEARLGKKINMRQIKIGMKFATDGDWSAIEPLRGSADAAGWDLRSDEGLWLAAGERILVSTGIRFEIPYGIEGQIRSRSGLARDYGVAVLNSPGTIDADYRGVVKVLLINHGSDTFHIKRGDRIAQIVFAPVRNAKLQVVFGELTETSRNDNGFGSTGVK